MTDEWRRLNSFSSMSSATSRGNRRTTPGNANDRISQSPSSVPLATNTNMTTPRHPSNSNHTAISSPKSRSNATASSSIPIRFFFLVFLFLLLQILFNLLVYLGTHEPPHRRHSRSISYWRQKAPTMPPPTLAPTPRPTAAPITEEELLKSIDALEKQIAALQQAELPRPYQHDDQFYPFTIRDSKRLSPVQVSPDFHIFDYADTTTGRQIASKNMEVWLDGEYLFPAACFRYIILCYKKKIIQVFKYLLQNTTANYFFYMESDNELCVPMQDIRDLAYRHQRYFIGTGIGFSGWIMNRSFIEDFLEAYIPAHKHANESPDPIGARLLMEKKQWAVTRNYLVSHSIKDGLGANSLTVGKVDKKTGQVMDVKHLPRCFEPKRTKWFEFDNSTEDMHGWDFFDSDDCPPETEIYPCRPDQYVNVTYGVKDMLKPKNETNAKPAQAAKGEKPRLSEKISEQELAEAQRFAAEMQLQQKAEKFEHKVAELRRRQRLVEQQEPILEQWPDAEPYDHET